MESLLHILVLAAFLATLVGSMQVQMNEDLLPEEKALRTRWLANKALTCEICHHIVDNIYLSADKNRGEKKKMEEIHIVEAVEDICKFDGAGGAWLRSVKIEENDTDDFEIVPISGVIFRSNCDVSCQTIYRSCASIMEKKVDIDELTGHMLKGGKKGEADKKVCSKICAKPKKTATKKHAGGGGARSGEL